MQLQYLKKSSLYISVSYALNILKSSDDFLSYRTTFLNSATTITNSSQQLYYILSQVLHKAYHNNSSITEVYTNVMPRLQSKKA